MKRFLIILFVVLVIAGCSNTQLSQQSSASSQNPHRIEITSSGFSPSFVIIKSGDTVIFTNKDSAEHWPASAAHPTHLVYPDAGGCLGSKFDACHGLTQGESWTFAFIHKGTWKYHDHLNPKNFGSITVE